MELQSVLLTTLLSFRKAGATRGCGHDSLWPACLTSIHSPSSTNSISLLCCPKLLCCGWLFATPWTSLPGFSVHRDSPGKNTGVGCHALLQGTFPTQGLNPGLPHCRQIPSHLSHQRSQEHWSRLSIPYSLPKFASPPGSWRGCGPSTVPGAGPSFV